uniref:Uncharacterized protein n=1 Tax=Glossina austeni TaxID=7395 RepID=A0A1A9US07_GLOAU
MCRSMSLTATTQRSQNINQASRRNSNNEIGHHNPKGNSSCTSTIFLHALDRHRHVHASKQRQVNNQHTQTTTPPSSSSYGLNMCEMAFIPQNNGSTNVVLFGESSLLSCFANVDFTSLFPDDRLFGIIFETKFAVSTDDDGAFTFPSPLATLATAAEFAAAKRRVVTTGLICGAFELAPIAVKLLLLGLEVLKVPEPQNE